MIPSRGCDVRVYSNLNTGADTDWEVIAELGFMLVNVVYERRIHGMTAAYYGRASANAGLPLMSGQISC